MPPRSIHCTCSLLPRPHPVLQRDLYAHKLEAAASSPPKLPPEASIDPPTATESEVDCLGEQLLSLTLSETPSTAFPARRDQASRLDSSAAALLSQDLSDELSTSFLPTMLSSVLNAADSAGPSHTSVSSPPSLPPLVLNTSDGPGWHDDYLEKTKRRHQEKTDHDLLNAIEKNLRAIDQDLGVLDEANGVALTLNNLHTEMEYPAFCTNEVPGETGRMRCNTPLLTYRLGKRRPVKPYLVASTVDYIARSMTNLELEQLCDAACDRVTNALHNGPILDAFDAQFFRDFKGPDSDKLFVNRGDKLRLAFAMHVDFFHPNGNRQRGNHESIGIVSLSNIALPDHIRYLPENLHLAAVFPGPKEPDVETMCHFLRPIIDEAVEGWSPGYHLTSTASNPENGRHMEYAIAISLNDFPAARKVSGNAAPTSHHFCTVCQCYGRSTMYRTDHEQWLPPDIVQLKTISYEYHNAVTIAEQHRIFNKHGVRWSELWRLPYWDPSKMLVVDSMHCLLEGIIHYHCRHVLCLDRAQLPKTTSQPQAAYAHQWTPYDPDCPKVCQVNSEKEIDHIAKIHRLLVKPLVVDPMNVNGAEKQLTEALLRFNKPPLIYVAYSLGLFNPNVPKPASVTKKSLAQALVEWRKTKPLEDGNKSSVPPFITSQTLDLIQDVIHNIVTPSWLDSVPHNYGDTAAGTIKAAEWRILSAVHIPIALLLQCLEDGSLLTSTHLPLLDHTMALFQASILACSYTTNSAKMDEYRRLLCLWVEGLHSNFPHTVNHHPRPNVHASFHIYDFLHLFGPVVSWWCFPFERTIGTLQKFNTNNHIGGSY
ncbi:hypothetical protein ONZ45_g14866 [Pleurotus djamor]|nr:hypothetical protein ONZ45_g14866 [Pleurotus djamor]